MPRNADVEYELVCWYMNRGVGKECVECRGYNIVGSAQAGGKLEPAPRDDIDRELSKPVGN